MAATTTDSSMRILVCVDISAKTLENIRAAAPGHTVHQTTNPREIRALLPGADVVFGLPDPKMLELAERLQWLQVHFAGIDRYATPEMRDAGFILTNARGVFGVAGAEHILGMMLMFNRGLLAFYRFQLETRWDRRMELAGKLEGQTLGVVGLGDIGSELARRGKAMGMRVLGIKRTAAQPPEFVDALWTLDRLDDLLREADHVALTLPLTRETRGLITGAKLDLMKPSAYLYNLGRGALIDEDALLVRLSMEQIAGAGLDVFVEEPLPTDHPFWRLPNVLITPHLGADTAQDTEEAAKIFCENLPRFLAGEELRNVVDLERGY